MTIRFYELAGAEEDRRFSPNCWRIRMALAHKGLEIESIAWRFSDKPAIAFSGQDRVPVIVDGERSVSDSWAIANYLEDAYPDRPTLFGGEGGRSVTRLVTDWTDTVVHPRLVRMLVTDIHGHLAEVDKSYFRQSREARFGASLEAVAADREERVTAFRESLAPLRATLQAQPFLGGAAPLYADYIVFGALQWARCISRFRLLEAGDPIAAWRDRLLAAHGGLAGRAKGYPA